MSTGLKRSHAVAIADAEAFRALFDGCYERWEIAGSVRRCKPEVADVEHVVIPKIGPVASGGLFNEQADANLLWSKLDALVELSTVAKHLYTSSHADGSTSVSPRWGDKYRGVDFRGFNHEIFTANPRNWGSILTIRTGPAQFSERMVTMLHPRGLQNDGGFVRYKRTGAIYETPTEESFFIACGQSFVAPEGRR
jgi:DNA polymerase/3'-5' exonuclease PolX